MIRLKEVLDAHKEEYLEELKALIRIDTHTLGHGIKGGLEKAGQEHLIHLFETMGASKIETHPLNEAEIEEALRLHNEGNLGHDYRDRFNVYATFQGTGGRSLLFNGHMDTMPAEKEQWSGDPHEPWIDGGRLHGLGACDMKSGLMASIMAVRLIREAGLELPGDVIITSVADEEGGGNGSIAAVMRGIRADGAVVCEPTDEGLILAHMGFVFFKVEIDGVAVHSGTKQDGVNAITKAVQLMQAIDELEHDWLLTYKHPLLPAPNSNVGVILGGTAGSTVPDRCEFKTCVHYLPEVMDHDQVVKEYTEAILLRSQGDAWLKDHPPRISVYQAGGPFEMELDHPLVQSFQAAHRTALDQEVAIIGSPAGCDSRIWRNMAGMPTLQYGPGTLAQCHAVDEYVDVQQYYDAILVYAGLILQWGGLTAKGGLPEAGKGEEF